LFLNLLIKKAVAGIMIPETRLYALTSHCAVAAFTLKSDMMLGRALLTADEVMADATMPSMRVTNISVRCLPAIGVSEVVMFLLLDRRNVKHPTICWAFSESILQHLYRSFNH